MKQIQQDVVQALRDKRNFRAGNGRDRVEWKGSHFKVYLWDNLIAEGNTKSRDIRVNDCGYATVTTTSRLNAVFAGLDLPVSVRVKDRHTMFYIHGNNVAGGPCPYVANKWSVLLNQEA